MISIEELRKTIEWLRDTTNENIIYIDKDLKRELGNAINDLLKLNEIYKSKIDKAIEYIKEHFMYHIGNDRGDIFFEDNYIQDLVEILGDKE